MLIIGLSCLLLVGVLIGWTVREILFRSERDCADPRHWQRKEE